MSDTYQPGRTRDEYVNGDIDALISAVMTDDAAIGNMMLAAERAGLDEDSPLVAALSREEQSRVLREARRDGQQTSMAMATGLAESSVDATGYDMLIDRLTPAAQQALVKGPKGSGKTVFVLDAAKRMYAEFDGELSIATNIKGPDEHDAVTSVFAGVPPAGKAETVARLKTRGQTVMVGDGTNDAPALAAADLGIALCGGTAMAADAADVAVIDDDLGSIETVFELSRAAGRRVKGNIGWALCYNAIAIPLAVTGLLNPLFAAVAMGLSSLLVVTNSSRPLVSS